MAARLACAFLQPLPGYTRLIAMLVSVDHGRSRGPDCTPQTPAGRRRTTEVGRRCASPTSAYGKRWGIFYSPTFTAPGGFDI